MRFSRRWEPSEEGDGTRMCDHIEDPLLTELVERCDRPNLCRIVHAFENPPDDGPADAIAQCIAEMFEESLDEADPN